MLGAFPVSFRRFLPHSNTSLHDTTVRVARVVSSAVIGEYCRLSTYDTEAEQTRFMPGSACGFSLPQLPSHVGARRISDTCERCNVKELASCAEARTAVALSRCTGHTWV